MLVEERFTKNLPDWKAIDKLGHSTMSSIIWALRYITLFAFFASTYWPLLLLPIIFTMGAFDGLIVNWFAHKYDHTNYKLKNTSKNLLSIDILMLGESYHNKRTSSIHFGRRWHEIDRYILLSGCWDGSALLH